MLFFRYCLIRIKKTKRRKIQNMNERESNDDLIYLTPFTLHLVCTALTKTARNAVIASFGSTFESGL